MTVLDDVGDPRRGSSIVLEHEKLSASVANNVDATDVDICSMRRIISFHLGSEISVSNYKLSWNDTVFQNFLFVIDVPQKEIERLHTLLDAPLQPFPVRGRDNAGDHIEGQDAVDGGPVAINCKSNSKGKKLSFRVG